MADRRRWYATALVPAMVAALTAAVAVPGEGAAACRVRNVTQGTAGRSLARVAVASARRARDKSW